MCRAVVERSILAECFSELVLLDVKGDEFSPDSVHLFGLHWSHCLFHGYRLLLDIVPLLWQLLVGEEQMREGGREGEGGGRGRGEGGGGK